MPRLSRRGFLGGLLAATAAPVVVRALPAITAMPPIDISPLSVESVVIDVDAIYANAVLLSVRQTREEVTARVLNRAFNTTYSEMLDDATNGGLGAVLVSIPHPTS
jgi:hypothetical protein